MGSQQRLSTWVDCADDWHQKLTTAKMDGERTLALTRRYYTRGSQYHTDYEFDFENMVQRNLESGTTRELRVWRVVDADQL